jgi:replicative DNA helicase
VTVATSTEVELTEPVEEEEKFEKYDLDAPFQTKIAALTVRDTVFNQRTDGLIRAEYFENVAEATLVNMALRYFKRYRKSPADASILITLVKDDIDAKIIRRSDVPAVKAKILEIYKADLSDRDYVIEKVATFARHQATAKAMEQAIRKLDDRDFDGIGRVMKVALDVGAHVDMDAYDYGEMIGARTGERVDRAAGMLPPTGITTGYEKIDQELYHRGWGKRELSVVLGGAKAGKTTALMSFGINAMAARFNVLYVTLEVSSRIIANRMDANISNVIMNELGEHIHDVANKVKDFNKRAGKFILHEFPTGSLTVSDLRRLIERYKARSIQFDLVIVDYADLMAPEHRSDNERENSKGVYQTLRGLAMQEDIALLTATQTNRDGYKAAVASAIHVAEDFNKVRIADIMISINKSEEEACRGEARLFFAASRNQKQNFTIRIKQDLDRMKFITSVEGTE